MEINLTHEEVNQLYPDLMRQLIAKLRATDNRDTQTPIERCQFYYSYGQSAQAMNLDALFQNAANDQAPNLTNNPKVNQLLRTVIGLSLAISAGRTRRYVMFNAVPQHFIDKFTAHYAEDIARFEKEEERLSKLSEEEIKKESKEEVDSAIKDHEKLLGLKLSDDLIKQINSKPIQLNLNDVLDKINRVGYDKLTDEEKKFLQSN